VRPIECFSAGWQLVRPQYLLMVGISAAAILVGSMAPLGILLGPLMCGLYLCLFALMRGERVEFGLLFKGFDHFVPSLIATLIQMVPMLIVLLPAYLALMVLFVMAGAAGARDHEAAAPALGAMVVLAIALFVFLFLVSIVVGVFFAFTYPLIVDRRLAGWDACRASARAVLANLGGMLGLVLINMVLGMVGMLLCYVGALLVLPIGFGALAVAYRRVFPDGSTSLGIQITHDGVGESS
jgi:uncharacterized membrane protein